MDYENWYDVSCALTHMQLHFLFESTRERVAAGDVRGIVELWQSVSTTTKQRAYEMSTTYDETAGDQTGSEHETFWASLQTNVYRAVLPAASDAERRRQRPGEQVGKAYFQQQQTDLTPVGAISDTITSIYNTKMASLAGDVDKQNELTFKLWDILAGSQDRVDDAIKAHLICDPDSVPPFVKRDLLALEVFIDTDQCDYCHDRCMVYDDESGSSYCDTCGSGGETRLVLETPFSSSKSSHNTNSQMSVGFETVHKHIYDRLSHFQTLLNNVQGRGNSKLCPRMIETLRTKARTLPGLSSVTYPWVMATLKTMRAGKFIPHAVRITQLVAQGFWNPPTIEPNDKNALVDGFVRVCEQYDRWIGENTDTKRKNFMSYPYIAYQLCMRQGLTDICGFFTLIKSDVRRNTQNKLWAVICEREKWAFHAI